jgi:arylsulfatase A-like enzyme
LTRGFRLYDDQMSVKKGPMYQDIAEGVLRRTKVALDARDTDKPLFLWVHFYDPHGPYSAPGEWFDRFSSPDYDGPYTDPAVPVLLRRALRRKMALPEDVDQMAARYLAEVHYMDHHIGELFSTLTERALLEYALVVVTADHGETLSELTRHAYSHGAGVDEGVLRIPLIIEGYGIPVARSAVVRSQVDMAGLAPTMATLVGLGEPLGAARSFAQLVRPGPVLDTDGWPFRPSRPSFSEATRQTNELGSGWNNAELPRAVRVGGLGMQVIPVRGLREERMRSLTEQTLGDPVRSLLKDLLFAWDMASPERRVPSMSTDTVDALEALGYIDRRGEDPGDHPEPSTP